MTKRYFFCLMMVVLCMASGLAQSRRNRPRQQKQSASQRRSAVGILYRTAGVSAHYHYCLLKTPNGIINFTATDGTRYTGFRNDHAWDLGAEWRVIYEVPRNPDDEFGPVALSLTFTGRVEPSIASAQNLTRKYLDLLSQSNYDQAYWLLSAAAKREINSNQFRSMYRAIQIDWREIIICSHAPNRVIVIMQLGPLGSTPYQRSEIVRTGSDWYINRLFPMTSDESALFCWKQ